MSNLLTRILTAVLAGGVAVTALVLSPWGSWVFGLIVSMLGLYEFYQITDLKSKAAKWTMLIFGGLIWAYLAVFYVMEVAVSTSLFLVLLEANWLALVMLALSLVAILMLFEKQVLTPVREMSFLAFGFLYAFLPMVLLFILSMDPAKMATMSDLLGTTFSRAANYDFHIPLGILILSWTVDTFAYFGGRLMGKHKLFERISPRKTWEGTVTGAVACVGIGILLNEIWAVENFSWIVVGAIVAVISQLGDLVESMFKRGLQIKDSGGILPGHGGMLDRFDGLYLAMPLIYVYYMVMMALNF